ncbi:MAG: type II toxin-antitoxin system RelE/ParE family toxin [Thermodesulfobacteriota bacterium]|nr:type II toxin-antitoxin system RelE/ParE family toxin [Thermodesulfobacteriota bacterium]
MVKIPKKIKVRFFKNKIGRQPVRTWLLKLSKNRRKSIGEDIKAVELGWPIGMLTVKPLGNKLYEVRTNLDDGTISRVFFSVYRNLMILLHGFIKKSKKTPRKDLDLARKRLKEFIDSQDLRGDKNE